jgi:HEAT repeat protein
MKSAHASNASGPELQCMPRSEGAHAATIRRMIQDAPPFRPGATCEDLVAEFASSENRMAAFLALCARGPEALPAVREGLKHPNCHIRRWSAAIADNFADAATLHALVPLLSDPNAQVRIWAVHSLSCETCKDGPNPIDAIPLLLERLESDENVKVRRQAASMLAHHRTPDVRVLPVFKQIMAEETDRKLRLHAEQGLERYSAAGLRE